MTTLELHTQWVLPALTHQDLQKRLALVTPGDTVRGFFFKGVLETVSASADEEATRRCLVTLSHTRFVDFFSYSIADFLRLTFTAAQCLASSQGGFEAALRRLGQQTMKSFLRSMAGTTSLSFAGNDERKLLMSLPVMLRTGVSYGERTLSWLGPRCCRISMKRDFMPPAYHEGQLQSLMRTLHSQPVEVHSWALAALDSEYVVSWD
jgi:uncharacterized protein (TIGR02265 family)